MWPLGCTNRFSAILIDQCHKQINESVKGTGGAVVLTANPSAIRKWMTATEPIHLNWCFQML